MNTTKTLMLAAVTVLTLGSAAAMAQTQSPNDAGRAQVSRQTATKPATNLWGRIESRVQAGASDFEHGSHVVPFNGDYSDLANPG